MALQVEINDNNIVIGISETIEPLIGSQFIAVNDLDASYLGMRWNGSSFEDVSENYHRMVINIPQSAKKMTEVNIDISVINTKTNEIVTNMDNSYVIPIKNISNGVDLKILNVDIIDGIGNITVVLDSIGLWDILVDQIRPNLYNKVNRSNDIMITE